MKQFLQVTGLILGGTIAFVAFSKVGKYKLRFESDNLLLEVKDGSLTVTTAGQLEKGEEIEVTKENEEETIEVEITEEKEEKEKKEKKTKKKKGGRKKKKKEEKLEVDDEDWSV